MKGKPWTVEEEDRLRQLLKANRSARAIARILGKSRECVSMKIARSGLEVVTDEKNSGVTTTSSSASRTFSRAFMTCPRVNHSRPATS